MAELLDLRVAHRPVSLRKQVHEILRRAIVDLQFAPGQRLVERELCELTGVSRAVIREVLRELEGEGLIEVVPNRGPVVASLVSTREARGIYETRAVLEALAGRAFAEKATDEERRALHMAFEELKTAYESGGDYRPVLHSKAKFYAILLAGARNETATALLRSLHDRISALRSMTLRAPGRGSKSIREIQDIVDAIEARNPDAAWDACILHVQSAANIAMSILQAHEASPPGDGMELRLPLSPRRERV